MLKIKKNKIFSKPIPLSKLIPNFLTLIGLLLGISSIRFALDGRWEVAAYCIFVAAIIDGLDGRLARLLNASSPFGAELDSLCDFANFGISPAVVIYLWSFQQYEYKVFSWGIISLFIVCMSLRLARFNVSALNHSQFKPNHNFFMGVPAPCGALLIIMPMILDFDFTSIINWNIRSHTTYINIYIAIISLLLVSRAPTISSKASIKPQYISLSMVIFTIFVVSMVLYPWYTLPILAVGYILSIPICAILINRRISD